MAKNNLDKRKLKVRGSVFLGKSEAVDKQDSTSQGSDDSWKAPIRLIDGETVLWASTGGAYFPSEELKLAVENVKAGKTKQIGVFNDDHKFGVMDVFGQTRDYEYGEDGDKAFVNCDVILFCREFSRARKTKVLVDTNTVRATSAEIPWKTAECSICKHIRHWDNPLDMCTHVKNHSFEFFNGKAVYEIFRGLSFDGACITREGADVDSQFLESQFSTNNQEQNMEMNGVRFDRACLAKFKAGGELTNTKGANEMTEAELAAQKKELEEKAAALLKREAKLAEAEEADKVKADADADADADNADNADADNADNQDADGKDDTNDADRKATDGLSKEEMQAALSDLDTKLELKDNELSASSNRISELESQLRNYKYEMKRMECQIIVDLMDARGDFDDEDEKLSMYWDLLDMSDAEVAGFKAVAMNFATKKDLIPLAMLEKGAKPVAGTAKLSIRKPKTILNTSGAVPSDVKDKLTTPASSDIASDFKEAFAPDTEE